MSTDPGAAPKQGLSGCVIAAIVVAFAGVALFCFAGIGLALLLPAVQAAREAGRRSQCMNDMKQISLALLNYHDVYHSFPPAFVADADGKPMHSWRVLILPFMEQNQLYQQYDFNEPWNGPKNSRLASQMPAQFRCPSDSVDGNNTNYVAVVGPETVWPGAAPVGVRAIRDGTSNTILLVENVGAGINWLEPRDLTLDEALRGINPPHQPGISSHHPGGADAVFCDGHVQYLSDELNPNTLRALLTKDGGEPVNPNELGY